jgi:alpha-glucosidase
MRAHSEIGSPNKEPWEYGNRFIEINRQTIGLRYRLLPYIYTVMEQASRTGIPAMRPIALVFPGTGEKGLTDDRFMFGDDVLVAPALEEGAEVRAVALPPGEWYDFWTARRFSGDTTITVEAPIDRIPFFVRGGATLPTQQLVQFTGQSPIDPLTLTVYPPAQGRTGTSAYYEDDGVSFRYEAGEFLRRTATVRAEAGSVTVSLSACAGSYVAPPRRLVVRVVGNRKPREVLLNGQVTGEQTEVTADTNRSFWQFDSKSGDVSIVMRDSRNSVTAIITY